MMKRLSYYIMLLGIVFFTSCEDFLDQVPKHNLTLDNAVCLLYTSPSPRD